MYIRCRAIDDHRKNVGHLVQKLRDEGITLKDWSSFQVVRMLIKETWPAIWALISKCLQTICLQLFVFVLQCDTGSQQALKQMS